MSRRSACPFWNLESRSSKGDDSPRPSSVILPIKSICSPQRILPWLHEILLSVYTDKALFLYDHSVHVGSRDETKILAPES